MELISRECHRILLIWELTTMHRENAWMYNEYEATYFDKINDGRIVLSSQFLQIYINRFENTHYFQGTQKDIHDMWFMVNVAACILFSHNIFVWRLNYLNNSTFKLKFIFLDILNTGFQMHEIFSVNWGWLKWCSIFVLCAFWHQKLHILVWYISLYLSRAISYLC